MEPNKSNIIIYQTEDGQTRIEVRMEEETVWLSQQQLSDLYQTSRPREPMWWNTSNIFMKKENQMKYQPVGNSDKFELRVTGRFQEKFLTTTLKFRQVRMQGAGNVSHNQAMDKATQEYHKFEVRTLSPVEQEYLRTIQPLNKKAKDKNREKPTK